MEIKKVLQDQLANSGVTVNGPNPWDIQVHNDQFYSRLSLQGSLGLGESYMDGWWDCDRIDEMITRIIHGKLNHNIKVSFSLLMSVLKNTLFNLQSMHRSFIVGRKHYDLGNTLFEKMLGKRMAYSCGYWKNASNLDEAQENKLELICRKLYLKPGMKILDIGCGWGSFAKYAAEKYQAQVTGITISKEQLELAKERCKGLTIELRLQDYRDLQEKFDHIVSVGQMEHVGYKNYRSYMEIARNNLSDDGLFLLHTIGSSTSEIMGDAWLEKYIFPNGMLPSIKQIGQSIEQLFVMEDWHNFGADYDKTLLAWHHNFVTHWDELKKDYDERFFRMWTYYLLFCAAIFRSRNTQLWQIVLSKEGVPGGYTSIR